MSPKPDEETLTDKSLGHTIRYLFSLLKDPKNLALAALFLGLVYDKGGKLMEPKDEYWDEASIQTAVSQAVNKSIDKRMGKFEAGWDAFVAKSNKDTRLAVFEAQMAYEKAHKDN